jgi:ribosome-associated toxin RatA of RatAB toxin-antitoxin module
MRQQRPSHAFALQPMPSDRAMTTVDEKLVAASVRTMFDLAMHVTRWPDHLPHYRYVRFVERHETGGLVEMSANRPFLGGLVKWPTRWTSLMDFTPPDAGDRPNIRFRHVRGITTGMDVEWTFESAGTSTLVRIVHVWNGPEWPLIGEIAARAVIGPIFVHGIASRTLAGLAYVAERMTMEVSTGGAGD